jgi:hypothetical protein
MFGTSCTLNCFLALTYAAHLHFKKDRSFKKFELLSDSNGG